MVKLKRRERIKMSLFFILFMVQLRELRSEDSQLTVGVGEKVYLPCGHWIRNQDISYSNNWLFTAFSKSSAKELFTIGEKDKKVKPVSDRHRVTGDFSLVINEVRVTDAGQYTCRQFDQDGRQRQSAVVYLFVINIHKEPDGMKISCSVLGFSPCGHSVEWLIEDNEDNVMRSPGPCTETVTLKTHDPGQRSTTVDSFKCKVTDKDGNLLLCQFSSRSCVKPATVLPWWLLVMVGVGAAAVPVTVGVVIRQMRSKGNNLLLGEKTPDPEDGVSYASVSYTRKRTSKAPVEGKTHDDDDDDDDDDGDGDGDAVTYSAVRASSCSPEASAASNHLDATAV